MAGFRAALKVRAIDVEVCSDLCLVVNQFRGDFEAKDPRILGYLIVRERPISDLCQAYLSPNWTPSSFPILAEQNGDRNI